LRACAWRGLQNWQLTGCFCKKWETVRSGSFGFIKTSLLNFKVWEILQRKNCKKTTSFMVKFGDFFIKRSILTNKNQDLHNYCMR
jgi:hypothetical protein